MSAHNLISSSTSRGIFSIPSGTRIDHFAFFLDFAAGLTFAALPSGADTLRGLPRSGAGASFGAMVNTPTSTLRADARARTVSQLGERRPCSN